MGVDTYFYTIYGVKMDWNDDFYEEYGEVLFDSGYPWALLDGMSGKYMIFGEPLFDSGNMRWGFEDGQVYAEIPLDNLQSIAEIYCNDFAEKFPKFKDLIKSEDFKLISLMHYS